MQQIKQEYLQHLKQEYLQQNQAGVSAAAKAGASAADKAGASAAAKAGASTADKAGDLVSHRVVQSGSRIFDTSSFPDKTRSQGQLTDNTRSCITDSRSGEMSGSNVHI